MIEVAPFACGIEVFEAEADGVDLAVALQALRLLLVRNEAVMWADGLGGETVELRHIGRCGRWRIVQQLAQHPGTALDGAGAFAIAAHGEDGGHAEQSTAW